MNNGTAYNEELDRTLKPEVLDTMSEVQDYALESSTIQEPIRQDQVKMTNTMSICPYCSSNIDADADFCESCHRYIRADICSYCGTALNGSEAFCPECGSSKGGIVCPICHTMNDFAFCKICGTPLTENARSIVNEVSEHPDYIQLLNSVQEFKRLNMCLPYESDRDIVKEQINNKLRERVLKLLANDRGDTSVEIDKRTSKRMSVAQLDDQKADVMQQITFLLEKLALVKADTPTKARNYVMATKPAGIRLAWICNYKNAMHSSPCGCAKPHLGGKWIILDKNNIGKIKDDK